MQHYPQISHDSSERRKSEIEYAIDFVYTYKVCYTAYMLGIWNKITLTLY